MTRKLSEWEKITNRECKRINLEQIKQLERNMKALRELFVRTKKPRKKNG